MKERVMLTRLQLRILQLIAEKGEVPTPSEIANELDAHAGSVSNSLGSLKQNRDVIKQFGEAVLRAEKTGAFEKPEIDPWQVRRRRLMAMCRQGYWVTKPPFGCKVKNEVVFFIDKWTAKIQLAFKLRAEGVLPSKIEEKTGITRHRLHSMFLNPVYAGKVRYNGAVFPGKHEDRAIISEELFEAAQPAKEGLFSNPPRYMRRVQGRFLWKDEKSMEMVTEMFRKRKEKNSFAEIGETFGVDASTVRYIIHNPTYAGKKQVDGELVDNPYIDAKIDFRLWQAAQKVNCQDKSARLLQRQAGDNADDVWRTLPGTKPELANKTGLTIDQVKGSLIRLKPKIVRLQDARWYRRDEFASSLRRELEGKGWKTLTPITPRGVETRDKILNILLEGAATRREITGKIGYDVSTTLRRYVDRGLIGKRPDDKYYISEENARFLRTVQDMLKAIRRQYN